MILTDKAIKAIKESAILKKELVYHLANTSNTLYRWVKENEENGTLTTFRSVELIKEFGKLKTKDILTKKEKE